MERKKEMQRASRTYWLKRENAMERKREHNNRERVKEAVDLRGPTIADLYRLLRVHRATMASTTGSCISELSLRTQTNPVLTQSLWIRTGLVLLLSTYVILLYCWVEK